MECEYDYVNKALFLLKLKTLMSSEFVIVITFLLTYILKKFHFSGENI